MKYRIVLWGIGSIYNHIRNTLRYFELTNQINIIGITSEEVPKAQFLDGYELVNPETLREMEFDYIFVLSDNYYQEIVHNAMVLYGISREKLVRYNVLLLPELCLERYFKLYNSQITILSNNCWGGMVYKTLGMECRSPLKNLFLMDRDYIKLLSNLEFYFSKIPSYIGNEVDVHSKKKYPILQLGDIEIHCNHSDSPEEAISDWTRRVAKVNFDNVFCEMYTENKDIARQFENLEQYKKRICFVPWNTNSEYQMKLELGNGQTEFWETVNSNAGMGSNALKYNLVDLLLGEKKYRLV